MCKSLRILAGVSLWLLGALPGCKNGDNEPLPNNSLPEAALNASPVEGSTAQYITFNAAASQDFDGSIEAFEWDFDGDGTYDESGTATTSRHIYSEPGDYTAGVRVTDNRGGTATGNILISVYSGPDPDNQAPVIQLSSAPAQTTTAIPVLFDATGTSDPDGTIAAYEWDWNDDGIIDFISDLDPTVSHYFSTLGISRMRLRAVDNKGLTASFSLPVRVDTPGNNPSGEQNLPPTALLTTSAANAVIDQVLTFDASGSSDPDGTIVKYEWNWDTDEAYDYDSEGNPVVTHAFHEPSRGSSSYVVTVRVTDNFGVAVLNSITVKVGWPEATKQPLWTYDAGGAIYGSAAFGDNGDVYIGSYSRELHALTRFGEPKWQFETNDWIRGTPVVGNNDVIYFGSYDTQMYAVDYTGDEVWSFDTDTYLLSSPVLAANGDLLVGSSKNAFLGIRQPVTVGGSAALRYSYDTGGSVNTSPALASDGTIYFGAEDGLFYALNANGTFKWSFPSTTGIAGSPVVGGNGNVYFGGNDQKLHALNAAGSELWNYMTGDKVVARPAVAGDGTVYCGSWDTYFYAVNPDGSLKWSYPTSDRIYSGALIGNNGTVYYGSNDGRLYAMNPDGTFKWALQADGHVQATPVLGPDGNIYVGDTDGNLYCIEQ